MAPPLKEIDEQLLQRLSNAQLSMGEMAKCLKCSIDTLERRYAAVIKDAREEGVGSVRRKLFEMALNGNTAAIIFFLKNYGGMTDGDSSNKSLGDNGIRVPAEFRHRDSGLNKPN